MDLRSDIRLHPDQRRLPQLERPFRLYTARLLLREFGVSDVQAMPPLIGDWAVAQWLARVPHPYREADAHDWLVIAANIKKSGKGFPLALERRDTGALIGGIGLDLTTGEVGYWIGQQHWGCGFVNEALAPVVDLAFQQSRLPHIWACVMPGNDRSCRVLEKAGFERKGKKVYKFRDGRQRGLYFRLRRKDWKRQ